MWAGFQLTIHLAQGENKNNVESQISANSSTNEHKQEKPLQGSDRHDFRLDDAFFKLGTGAFQLEGRPAQPIYLRNTTTAAG